MNINLYINTPSILIVDNRGLSVRQIQYHRRPDLLTETDERITRQTFNLSGSLIQSLSPRQYDLQQANSSIPANQKIFSSLSGQILRTDSTDEGTQSALSDIAGRSLISINAMKVKRIWQYEDAALPGRLLTVTEMPEGEIARIVERFLWAGSSAAEKAKNLVGSNTAHYHCSGVDFIDSIALTGSVLSERRRFLKDELVSDWQNINNADNVLAEAVFNTSVTTDASGAILTQTDTQGNRQRKTYNVAGQLKSSGLTLSGQTTEQMIIRQRSYTAAGQIIQEIAGNGVVTSYSYEPETQRLIGIKTERPNGHASGAAVLQDLRYAFDPVGNVISVRNDAEATRFWRNQKIVPEKTYVYDSLYQLVSATGREMAGTAAQRTISPIASTFSDDKTTYTNYTRTYRYDRDDNLVRIQHNAPATGNQYNTALTVSSRSNRSVLKTLTDNSDRVEAFFDAAGNQLELLPGQTLSWNQRGELQQVTPVTRNTEAASDREWYRYDVGGQRVLKATYQMQGNSQRLIRKLYLAGLESVTVSVTPLNQGSSQTEVYDRIIAGTAEVLHWQLGKPSAIANDIIRFSHSDRMGNSALETDKDGLVISQEEFYPFGETAVWLVRTQLEADYKTYRYSGKERDATGLYYYGFRYYQSWVGRWLSADPAGAIDGLNQYRMVRNNPSTFWDSDGLMTEEEKEAAAVVQKYFVEKIKPQVLARKEADKEKALKRISAVTRESGEQLGQRYQKVISKLEGAHLAVHRHPKREIFTPLSTSSTLLNRFATSKGEKPQYETERNYIEQQIYDVGKRNLDGFTDRERRLFEQNYQNPSSIRPVYGALSFNNELKLGPADKFGSSVFYLNDRVYENVTITPFDSYSIHYNYGKDVNYLKSSVAIKDNLNPLIFNAHKAQMSFLVNIEGQHPDRYFEWQSHAPIVLEHDVESFRLNWNGLTNSNHAQAVMSLVDSITTNNNIVWLDKPTAVGGAGGGGSRGGGRGRGSRSSRGSGVFI